MPLSEVRHILIVDNNERVRTLLRNCFEEDGYRVSEAQSEAEIFEFLETDAIDLITLELSLGSEDGLSLAQRIRAASAVPVIIVSEKGDPVDRIIGLEMGADDYICKPFHLREVLARVHSVLRRTGRRTQPDADNPDARPRSRFVFDGYVIDSATLELRASDGTPIDLTTSEFRLLEVLVKHPKRVMSRDQLMDQLNGRDWSPYDRSIDNRISRLRKKIEQDPNKPRLIKTVRGAGYSLAVDVRAV
jgi:DNA-binding response OmpR family regulator